jgi:hypothetical protein
MQYCIYKIYIIILLGVVVTQCMYTTTAKAFPDDCSRIIFQFLVVCCVRRVSRR